jgi:hypothetical protein
MIYGVLIRQLRLLRCEFCGDATESPAAQRAPALAHVGLAFLRSAPNVWPRLRQTCRSSAPRRFGAAGKTWEGGRRRAAVFVCVQALKNRNAGETAGETACATRQKHVSQKC